MDKTFRNEQLAGLHPEAQAASHLASMSREYTLYEIAIMTRAGPARTLGLSDRGHLGAGAAADITVYSEDKNREKMFSAPDYVFKDGELVARNGKIVKVIRGATHTVKPAYDRGIEKRLQRYFERFHSMRMENFAIGERVIRAGQARFWSDTLCDYQRHRHRRYLRGSLRHEGDALDYHRPQSQVGAAFGGGSDWLCHFGDRLRLRGGRRARTERRRDTRCTAWRSGAAVCDLDQGTHQAGGTTCGHVRADLSHQRRVRRRGDGGEAAVGEIRALFRRRLPDLQTDRRQALLAHSGNGRRFSSRGHNRHGERYRRRQFPGAGALSGTGTDCLRGGDGGVRKLANVIMPFPVAWCARLKGGLQVSAVARLDQ